MGKVEIVSCIEEDEEAIFSQIAMDLVMTDMANE